MEKDADGFYTPSSGEPPPSSSRSPRARSNGRSPSRTRTRGRCRPQDRWRSVALSLAPAHIHLTPIARCPSHRPHQVHLRGLRKCLPLSPARAPIPTALPSSRSPSQTNRRTPTPRSSAQRPSRSSDCEPSPFSAIRPRAAHRGRIGAGTRTSSRASTTWASRSPPRSRSARCPSSLRTRTSFFPSLRSPWTRSARRAGRPSAGQDGWRTYSGRFSHRVAATRMHREGWGCERRSPGSHGHRHRAP